MEFVKFSEAQLHICYICIYIYIYIYIYINKMKGQKITKQMLDYMQ